jgi:glycosyltransferase involved in cell wall biosynthesis
MDYKCLSIFPQWTMSQKTRKDKFPMPAVSVIIPTYNRAEFLRLAITSVLNQTFQDFEIIVVDDTSEDHTHEVVSDFSDKRIKYIRHEVNKRVAAARNTGVLNSSGDYIAFLDDDDEWLPRKLQMQVALLEDGPSTLGGVYTGFTQIDRSTGQILQQIVHNRRGDIYNDLLKSNFIGPASTILLRRECFDRVGLFDESIEFGEEYDLLIRVSKEFHFECVPECLVTYWFHENKLSTNVGVMIRGLEAQIRKYGESFSLHRKYFSDRYRSLAVLYCYAGNIGKTRESYSKAIKMYPITIRVYFYFCLTYLGERNFKKVIRAKETLTIMFRRFYPFRLFRFKI